MPNGSGVPSRAESLSGNSTSPFGQNLEEAKSWLIHQLEQLRQSHLFGVRAKRTFDDASAKYLLDHQDKVSIESDIYHLEGHSRRRDRRPRRGLTCSPSDSVVFVWTRGVKKVYVGGSMETMNNTAWQRARKEIGIPDLHIHDLRHTVGMRLREAEVREETIADIL